MSGEGGGVRREEGRAAGASSHKRGCNVYLHLEKERREWAHMLLQKHYSIGRFRPYFPRMNTTLEQIRGGCDIQLIRHIKACISVKLMYID